MKILDIFKKLVEPGNGPSKVMDDAPDPMNNGQKKTQPGKGRRIFFWVAVTLAAMFFLASLSLGLVPFLLVALMWGIFLSYMKKFAFENSYSAGLIGGIFTVVLVSSMIFVGAVDQGLNGGENDKNLEKYSNKVYNLVSADEKLTGTAAITVQKNKNTDQYLSVRYNILIDDQLPANDTCPSMPNGCQEGKRYYKYANNLVEEGEFKHEGELEAIFCNKNAVIQDPFQSASEIFHCKENEKYASQPTAQFLATFTKSYNSIKEFLNANQFEIYDAAQFQFKKEETSDSTVWATDYEKAVKEGEKVRSYEFTILK